MSSFVISSKSSAVKVADSLYDDLSRRIASNSVGVCPVDLAGAFVRMALSQSCGKCAPCRVGLKQLSLLIEQVLDGEGTSGTIDLIEKTARVIVDTADCAIGYEGARMVLNGVIGFRDDYEAHIKGNCLAEFEGSIPCVHECPAKVDIPGYIALVKDGRYADAVRLIRKDNPFPSACAFICEHPCESHCRRRLIDDSINIRALKRMAVDNSGVVANEKCSPATGKTVAIIGGGPSGLTAAYYLSLMGHKVTVYEKRKQLGGMLRYGIPSYRLPREILDKEIESILSVGITAYTDTDVSENGISFNKLREEFDAVYISIGAHTDNKLGIDGEDAKGVLSAVDMLRGIGDGIMPDFKGKKVIVIGGGNVAMDCTRSSMRLGAEHVSCVYRRRKADMTALPDEIEGAMAEGCEILELMAPKMIEADENGNVKALVAMPQMISDIKRGRPSPINAEIGELKLEADIVVVAIGQSIDSVHFNDNSIPTKWGRILADNTTKIAGVDGVFSGGDCVTGPATAIRAIAAGKAAASQIDNYLGFDHEITVDVKIPEPSPMPQAPCGRINLSERRGDERKNDFKLMENMMTSQQAAQESARCLRCDKFGCGAFKGGRKLAW